MNVIELEPRYFNRLACLMIVIIGLTVYSNTIHCSFQFDDYNNIVDNLSIRDLHNIPQFFQDHEYYYQSRGLYVTSLAVNYYFSRLSVEGYHWVNISIHLLNGMLVYFLAIIILSQYVSRESGTGFGRDAYKMHVLALFVALFFVASPIQTHGVTYICKRHGLMASFFYLLSLVLFIKAVKGTGIRPYLYAASLLSFLSGVWCKEITYTAPAIMLLYYQCFVAKQLWSPGRGLRLVLPYIVLLAVSFYITAPLRYESQVSSSWGWWEYLLTQSNVLIEYVRLLLLPIPSRLNVDVDFPLAGTLWEFPTLLSAAAIVAILITAMMYLDRARLLAFCVLWFLVILVPTSSIIPLPEIMVSYRLYLPGFAFYLLLVVGINKVFYYLGERKGFEPKRLWQAELAVLISIVLFYSACTYEHNKVWKTSISLWEDTIQKSPHKIRPHYSLGRAYQQAGLKTKAREQYMICKELYIKSPNTIDEMGLRDCSMACNNLAVIYYEGAGLYNVAMSMFKEAISIDPKNACAHSNLGLVYYHIGKMDEAEAKQKLALRMNSHYMLAYARLGLIYRKKGMLEEAIRAYTNAKRLSTDQETLKKLNQTIETIEELRRPKI